MTQLLVSVRDRREARIAATSGADLIDIKEPFSGSLGAATIDCVLEIAEDLNGLRPLSVALGEVVDPQPYDPALLPDAIEYAKFGLAGCARINDWCNRWQDTLRSLPRHVRPVAVVYADCDAACSPASEIIVERAAQLGCAAVLVDTWRKAPGPLNVHWSLERISSFVLDVQRRGMRAVIGGGLTEALLPEIKRLGPDYVAVRGAACAGNRTASIDGRRVGRLAESLNSLPLPADSSGSPSGRASRSFA